MNRPGPSRIYTIHPTNRYAKDVKKLVQSGFDMHRLKEAVELLSTDVPLPEKYKDHELKGTMKGVRECHIGPDWLLLYTKDRGKLILVLVRTGSHRRVLGIE
jgi:mRNA interferase YafQ